MVELISVVMPVFNAGKYLHRSVSSVLSQTYSNLELVVIDDCSTDDSMDVLQGIQNDNLRVYRFKENLGVAEARNKGMLEARGRYVAFCDADDYWLSDKLEKQIELMRKTGCAICGTNTILCDENDEPVGIRSFKEHVSLSDMYVRNYITNSSAVMDTAKLSVPFQQKIYHEDYMFWLELFGQVGEGCIVQEFLTYYRVHSKSISSNKFRGILGHVAVQRRLKVSRRNVLYYLSLNAFERFHGKVLEIFSDKKIKIS